MLRNYRSATPWRRLAEVDDEQWVTKLLTGILAGAGVVFLAEEKDNTVGLWLEYERNLALAESSLYTKGH
jgi:hypothetical protein